MWYVSVGCAEMHTVRPIDIQTITFFISASKQDREPQNAARWCPGVDENKAIATLLSYQASDVVWRLYTTPNIGKCLNVERPYGMLCEVRKRHNRDCTSCDGCNLWLLLMRCRLQAVGCFAQNLQHIFCRMCQCMEATTFCLQQLALCTTSFAVLAEISLRSPRSFFTFTIKKYTQD